MTFINSNLLKELLVLLEQYEASGSTTSLSHFLNWSREQQNIGNAEAPADGEAAVMIAFQLLYLSRDVKRMVKPVLSDSPLTSLDDYSFLLHLEAGGSFRKMELIELHHLEPPTGIEIINRLIRANLIEDFPDPDDGRAKRIRLTKAGQQLLKKMKPAFSETFTPLANKLGADALQLSSSLNKLIH